MASPEVSMARSRLNPAFDGPLFGNLPLAEDPRNSLATGVNLLAGVLPPEWDSHRPLQRSKSAGE
jgi:hypothetical protein